MAITILQQPSSVSFSGDPIIIKAKTTLTDKQFLRIELHCIVEIMRIGDSNAQEELLSYPIGYDGIAVFNIGSIIKYSLEKYNLQEVNNMAISQTLYAAKYYFVLQEVYFNGYEEEYGARISSENFIGMIGSLTEYERMIMKNQDTSLVIKNGRILSRKPAGEMIVRGIDSYIPAVSSLSDKIEYYITQGGTEHTYSKYTGGKYIPASLRIYANALSPGELMVDTDIETGVHKFVVYENNSMRHFLFLNGFGLIESITAVTREALSYSVESTKYSIPSDIQFNRYTRVISYTNTPQVQLDMSSGYVNREWAEWWVNEFLPTRMTWMILDGRYIPVAIIPEKNNKLFDRSKPGMMAVQFKVQYSFAGGTHNSFVK